MNDKAQQHEDLSIRTGIKAGDNGQIGSGSAVPNGQLGTGSAAGPGGGGLGSGN